MATKRKSTGKRARFEVFKRDKFTCQYCGNTPPAVVLVVDHILPVSKGGGNEMHNLATACEACNQGKSDKLLEDVPESIESQLAKEIERREQLKQYNAFLMKARNQEQKAVIRLACYWADKFCRDGEHGKFMAGDSRRLSIAKFVQKMPEAKILEAMDIAAGSKAGRSEYMAFKYFCGVCWRMIERTTNG